MSGGSLYKNHFQFAHLSTRFVRYIGVGVINSIVGLGLIFGLTYAGAAAELANFIGYAVGILVSYALNRRFTFGSTNAHARDFTRFLICMGAAFLANFTALVIAHRILGYSAYFSQFVGISCYTLIGFLLSHFWGFAPAKSLESALESNADSKSSLESAAKNAPKSP